jgi:catechol 2,3-dioxygenase-like lactoylglutathione lyase family enzyme
MITGLHAIVFTADAEADRAFFRDVLEFSAVDAGGGWLVFTMPPAELACHPTQTGEPTEDGERKDGWHELYLMCDDVRTTVATLKGKGVQFNGPITDESWGLLTSLTTPGGTRLGLYPPTHPTALSKQSES